MFKTRNNALAVKVEAEAGTYEAPTMATDRVRLLGAGEPEIGHIAPNTTEDAQTGTQGNEPPQVPAGRFIRVPIRWAAIGAGVAYAAGVLPEHNVLYRAAGFSLAVDATLDAEKATYTLADDPSTCASALLHIGGMKYEIAGAVVEALRKTCSVNQFPIFEGTLVGVLHNDPAAQAFTAPAYTTLQSLIWQATGALALGAITPAAQTFELALNSTAAPNTDANAADGLVHYSLMERRPIATVGARVKALATWNPEALKVARTAVALTARFGKAGEPGQYKRLNTTAGRAVYDDVQHRDNAGFRDWIVQLLLADDANELSLVFD